MKNNAQTRVARFSTLAISAALLAMISPPTAAVRQGERGTESTASVGISLEIRSSLRTNNVSLSSHSDRLLPSSSGYRICLDVAGSGLFSVFAFTRSGQRNRLTPLPVFAGQPATVSGQDCRGDLRFDIDELAEEHDPNRPLTLIISPM